MRKHAIQFTLCQKQLIHKTNLINKYLLTHYSSLIANAASEAGVRLGRKLSKFVDLAQVQPNAVRPL